MSLSETERTRESPFVGSRGKRSVSSNTLVSGQPSEADEPSASSSSSASTPLNAARRTTFGMNFLSSFTRHGSSPNVGGPSIDANSREFMSNSPTIANLHSYTEAIGSSTANGDAAVVGSSAVSSPVIQSTISETELNDDENPSPTSKDVESSAAGSGAAVGGLPLPSIEQDAEIAASAVAVLEAEAAVHAVPLAAAAVREEPAIPAQAVEDPVTLEQANATNGSDKDGLFSIRLTPLIDHSSSTSGLYFAPIIRKIKPGSQITVGRYTEKNKSAAHAPQGSSAPVVFKSKVVSRTHALFQCNEDGQWLLRDCKSSSGTFLNHVRLSPASQELTLMPLVDGDIIQLGMDYRGGTEEVYRCVKMRCEFNKSWQRKVNQFNLEIHKKLKNLAINEESGNVASPAANGGGSILNSDELSECAICLLKLEPCQALFISPCSHSWHYKCIRPIIIKSYPQFYCPNCRSMCDLETDIEDDD